MISDKELEKLKEIIIVAGDKVLKIYQQKKFAISEKSDRSPVTDADIESNKIIVSKLKSEFEYDIISEESWNVEDKISESKTYWVIDPLDGTKNFVEGSTDFSIMIGLLNAGKPVFGMVYIPITGELFYAERGKGAFGETKNKKPQKLTTSDNFQLSEFRILLSKNHLRDDELGFVEKSKITSAKQLGSVGIKLCIIAKGGADIYVNFDGLNIWDLCGPMVILKEAGGNIYDNYGNEFIFNEKRFTNGVIATNGNCKKKIIDNIANINMKIGKFIWITGLAGSGKTAIAKRLFKEMKKSEPNTIRIDGDDMRKALGGGFSYSIEDRKATAYIYSKLGHLFTAQGSNVILSTISLFHELHDFNRKNNKHYYEILVDVRKEELIKRNKKNLYKYTSNNVMGIHQEPEFPRNPTLRLENDKIKDLDNNVKIILKLLKKGD